MNYNIYSIVTGWKNISKKDNFDPQKHNPIIAVVKKNSSKAIIKLSIESMFNVSVKSLKCLICKGKKKKNKNTKYIKQDFKKVFITLKKGNKINLS